MWIYKGEILPKNLVKKGTKPKMLQPTRTKFRKAHKGRIHGNASRCNMMNYGSFGLKAIQPERIISRQIEATRVALTRHMKRQGRVWTRMFLTYQSQKNQQK